MEKEIKKHVDFTMQKIINKIIEENLDNIAINNFKQIKGDTIYNIWKKYNQIFKKKDYYLNQINVYIYGYTPMK